MGRNAPGAQDHVILNSNPSVNIPASYAQNPRQTTMDQANMVTAEGMKPGDGGPANDAKSPGESELDIVKLANMLANKHDGCTATYLLFSPN